MPIILVGIFDAKIKRTNFRFFLLLVFDTAIIGAGIFETCRRLFMATKKQLEPVAPAADKKKALEAALGQIEKQFGKGSVMRLGENAGMNIDHIPTGSIGLDLALGIGGLPRGRIVEIYGPESSGKT